MYRIEIDGLRALSLVLIILFHLHISIFDGAYIGPDVFFVISGYLITAIIVDNLIAQQFSLRDFYLRRITRIIPTLLAIIILAMLGSILLLTPKDLIYAAKQGVAALFSVGNIFYWTEAGYWDPSSKYKIFLHTWTLGVEEQFYLLYPPLLLIAFKLGGRKGVIGLLLLMLIGGTAASEYWLGFDPAASFYLTPLRFYEFALGGLASLTITSRGLPGRWEKHGEITTLLGLALIGGSVVVLDSNSPFPGLSALPSAIGALCIILAGPTWSARLLLSNRPMVWFGKASFSVYLIHWPIFVLYRYYSGPNFTPLEMVCLVIATLISGAILHNYVERPMRLSRSEPASLSSPVLRRRVLGMSAAAVLICGTTLAIVAGQGWPSRLPDSVRYLAERSPKDTRLEKEGIWDSHCAVRTGVLCGVRQPGMTNIIMLADSRGMDINIALRTAYPTANIMGSYKAGCPAVFSVNVATHPRYPGCVELNQQRLAAALDAPAGDIVFLAMDFNWLRAHAIVDTTARLVASGKHVYVIGETQFLSEQDALTIAVQHGSSVGIDRAIAANLVELPFALEADQLNAIQQAGGTLILNRPFFQPDGYRLYTRDGADLIMYDRFHLTVPGAIEYGEYLAEHYPLPVN